MSNVFYMPPVTLMGPNAIQSLGAELASKELKKALIVTDGVLVEVGLVSKLTDELTAHGIDYAIYDGVQPNPTEKNIEDGLTLLAQSNADFVISFGGDSSHDTAKGIALVAANGGHIRDYSKGVHLSKKPQLPLVTVNTTAGTASEMTVFAIITNQEDETKYPVVDKHFTPIIAVNDSELMVAMPKFLTATTGMNALTHAIDALSEKVGTKQRLTDLGVTEDKLAFMAQNALNDACSLTNPRKASLEEIVNIFKARM